MCTILIYESVNELFIKIVENGRNLKIRLNREKLRMQIQRLQKFLIWTPHGKRPTGRPTIISRNELLKRLKMTCSEEDVLAKSRLSGKTL